MRRFGFAILLLDNLIPWRSRASTMMGWIGGGPRPWQQQTQLIWMPSGESSSKRALTSARSVTTWRSRETSVLVSPRIASSARVTMVVQRHRPVRLGERAEDPDLDGADRDVAAALPKAAGAVGLEPVQAGRSVAAAVVCAPRLFARLDEPFHPPAGSEPGPPRQLLLAGVAV